MKRFLGVTIAILALAALLGSVLKGGPGSGAVGAGGGGDAAGPLMSPGDDGLVTEHAARAEDGGGTADVDLAEVPLAVSGAGAPDDPSARVIKTASLELGLERGRFDEAYREASLVASRLGGFVASSSTTRFEDARGATLILRVPATRFDEAIADLRGLGEVLFEESSGQDVTDQFVDLEARLRNWEAQESVLLRLMAEAGTIDESIKVQRNLSEVQLEIERIRGRLRLLRDQTDMGTITVSMTEGDATALTEPEDGSILGNAWREAIEGFQNVLAATVVGLGYLIPIGLLVLLGWVAFRRLRTPAAPAVE